MASASSEHHLFGRALATARKKKFNSQVAFAEATGVSRDSIKNAERGVTPLTQPLFEKLLATLEPEDCLHLRALWIAAQQAHRDFHQQPALDAHLSGTQSKPYYNPHRPPIGRDGALAELAALIDSGARLITIVGSAGIGKSNTLHQVAARLRERGHVDVTLLDLVAFDATALERVLTDSSPYGGRVPDDVSQGPQFLLLDNIDIVLHNSDGAINVAELLQSELARRPSLRMIITCRNQLRVDDERVYRIGKLSTVAATELFMQSARLIDPGLAVGTLEQDLVGWICERLDQLPLAIVLVTSRLRLLRLTELYLRLERELFPYLIHGSPKLPLHQQTMDAAITWDIGSIGDGGAVLLRRLTIFEGGWTLEAAESVCDGDGMIRHFALAIPAGLEILLDANLIWAAGDGPTRRFGMLHTIHDYAARKFLDPERENIARRHTVFYLGLVEVAENLTERGLRDSVTSLSTDQDNIRAALERAIDVADVENALRLATALAGYWLARRRMDEADRYLNAALRLPNKSPIVQARALAARARLALEIGEAGKGRGFAEEALVLNEGEDHALAAEILAYLGIAARQAGDFITAIEYFDRVTAVPESHIAARIASAIAVNRAYILAHQGQGAQVVALLLGLLKPTHKSLALRDQVTVMKAIGDIYLLQDQTAKAHPYLERALALAREMGDRLNEDRILAALGRGALAGDGFKAAAQLLYQALNEQEKCGDWRALVETLIAIGTLEYRCKEAAEGHSGIAIKEEIDPEDRFRSAYILARRLGDRLGMVWAAEHIAVFLATVQEVERSARWEEVSNLLGATSALRKQIGAPPPETEREDLDSVASKARAALGEVTFEKHYAIGFAARLTTLDGE